LLWQQALKRPAQHRSGFVRTQSLVERNSLQKFNKGAMKKRVTDLDYSVRSIRSASGRPPRSFKTDRLISCDRVGIISEMPRDVSVAEIHPRRKLCVVPRR